MVTDTASLKNKYFFLSYSYTYLLIYPIAFVLVNSYENYNTYLGISISLTNVCVRTGMAHVIILLSVLSGSLH